MRLFSCVCVAAFAAFSLASASADTWSGAYGNTILSTYSDGRLVKVYVDADHTYSIVTANGTVIKGTWADGSGGSCFTTTSPPPAPDAKPICFPIKDYKLGDSFGGADASGSFTGVIQPGR